MVKNYGGTSIGFVTNERPKAASVFNNLSKGASYLKDNLSSKFGFLSSPAMFSAKPSPSFLKMAVATTALSSLAIAFNPDIAGATVGDFERGREAATSHTAVPDKGKSKATRLGEFIGNFENEFNKGSKEGVNAVMQRRIQPPSQ